MTHITIHSDSLPLYEYIMPNVIPINNESTITEESMYKKVKVFINGAWVGITHDPQQLYLMPPERLGQ